MNSKGKEFIFEEKVHLNKNVLINPIHFYSQNFQQGQFAAINKEFVFKVETSEDVPENFCYLSSNARALVFGMSLIRPATIELRCFDENQTIKKLKFYVSKGIGNICKQIRTQILKKHLLSQINWFNQGEMFEMEYKSNNQIYKINLVAKIENQKGGFLTQNTKIQFQKQIHQKFNLVEDKLNEEEESDYEKKKTDQKGFLTEMKKKIGGQDHNLELILKLFFNVRMLLSPQLIKKLGLKHIKGILFYGPPGTGKTAIARQMAAFSQLPVSIINGPEIMDKYVGQSQKKIRQIFDKAKRDEEQKGVNSQVHVIIIDQIDAICKKRGTNSTNVYDSIVNQLLTCIDGVQELNNILIIAMTNRKDLIDDAVLRPGRIQVHIQIFLPNQQGRRDILDIHTHQLRSNNLIHSSVDFDRIAKLTQNFTGAQIQALVRKAFASALHQWKQLSFSENQLGKKYFIDQSHFEEALKDINPQFGTDTTLIESKLPKNPIPTEKLFPSLAEQVSWIFDKINGSDQGKYTILIQGKKGVGKTAFACWMAQKINFDFTKMINIDKMIGLAESGKLAKLSDVMFDSLKCQTSCIIFDQIVDLIEYVPLDKHYSRAMLQGFLQVLKKTHENGKKTVIIVTEARKQLLKQLGLYSTFDFKLALPEVQSDKIEQFLQDYGYSKNQVEKVTSQFRSLSLRQVCDIVEATKNNKQSLEKFCNLLKMRRDSTPLRTFFSSGSACSAKLYPSIFGIYYN